MAHGLKRTNADKRRSVELALAEWPNVSDRQIAEICAVGHDMVAGIRAGQLAENASCEPQPRVGKDGKARKPMKLSNSTKHSPAPPPAFEPEPELFPRRRQFTVELSGQALSTLDERIAKGNGKLIDIEPVKGARWRVRYLAPGPISFANE